MSVNSMKRCDYACRVECKGEKCKGICENESVKVVINEVPVSLFELVDSVYKNEKKRKNFKASRQTVAKVYVNL